MPKTVVGLFERTLLAEDAIQKLQKAGFERNNISIVAREGSKELDSGDNTMSKAVAGAGAGAIVGGIAGLVAGLGALTIPGVGPVIAAGPLAAALSSAGIGAAAGGLIGALTGINIPESDANYYAEEIRRGGALVVVKTDDEHAQLARQTLNDAGAQDIGDGSRESSPTALTSEHEIERNSLSQTNEPAAPQITRTGARIYMDGLEMDPRKSRFEDFDTEYRDNFATRFAASGYSFEQFSPAYHYGYSLAGDPRYQGGTWDEIEPEARREWEQRNPGTWPTVRDAVQHAFERVQARVHSWR